MRRSFSKKPIGVQANPPSVSTGLAGVVRVIFIRYRWDAATGLIMFCAVMVVLPPSRVAGLGQYGPAAPSDGVPGMWHQAVVPARPRQRTGQEAIHGLSARAAAMGRFDINLAGRTGWLPCFKGVG